jgi:hypothetical protein
VSEQIGLWIGLVLTLMVFSYLLGDNILYRIAVYLFSGLSAGYAILVTVDNALLPWLRGSVLATDATPLGMIIGVLPFALLALLMLKGTVRFNGLGQLALAFLIGVGTAVALVGAISGTIIPLANATSSAVRLDPLNGFLAFVGVVGTLMYFQYIGRRAPGGGEEPLPFSRVVGAVGRGVVVITLGALYAGAILTSLTIFSERISFILARITGG